MSTLSELRERVRLRVTAALGAQGPCTAERLAFVCTHLVIIARGQEAAWVEAAGDDRRGTAALLASLTEDFADIIERLRAEESRLRAEARQRDLSPADADLRARTHVAHEFVMAPEDWALIELPPLSLRQIRAEVDRKLRIEFPGGGEGSRWYLRRALGQLLADPSGVRVRAEMMHEDWWGVHHQVCEEWIASAPLHYGVNLEMLRRALTRIADEATAGGMRRRAALRLAERRLAREFIGRLPARAP